jgi:hypothetical protein
MTGVEFSEAKEIDFHGPMGESDWDDAIRRNSRSEICSLIPTFRSLRQALSSQFSRCSGTD